MRDEKEILNRWRLALGRYAEGPVYFSEGSLPYGEMDQVLEFLYSREYGEEQEIRKDRGGKRRSLQPYRTPPGLRNCAACFPSQPQRSWSAMLWKSTI